MRKFFWTAFITLWGLGAPAFAWANNEFHCEVLAVQADVKVRTESGGFNTLKEGDLLSEGDTVEVPDDGSLEMAYDKDWNNVVRLEGGTVVKVLSVSPAYLEMTRGSVYAKLKALPKKTSFEVRTPTAVAAVRGTEYRTVIKDGQTEVFNFSPSKVFVYGVEVTGLLRENPEVLEQDHKTIVEAKGTQPQAAVLMKKEEKEQCESAQKAIEAQISRAVSTGRIGKVQTVYAIEQSISAASQARYDEESRVSDTRRRSFK